jgi:dihydroorotate dehydrogenase
MRRLKQLDSVPLALDLLQKKLTVHDPALRVSIRTLTCPNPVGLAAGFDKGAEVVHVLSRFGFGFLELGTFTPLIQEGQKKPRMFRCKKDRAIINRMGFNNPGVKVGMERLKNERKRNLGIPVGVNLGKGRDTPVEEAVEDYITAFEHSEAHADYITVNVSSPNTPNLRDLQMGKLLRGVLVALSDRNKAAAERRGEAPKIIFCKVSPDLHDDLIEEIAQAALDTNVGLIATNTTIDHGVLKHPARKEQGGLSGAPLREKSNYVLKRLAQLTKGVVPLIGVGGVFTAEDAYEKIRLGASLVQVYTGWIYEGPAMVPKINQGLLKLMKRDGFKNIQQAVGTGL